MIITPRYTIIERNALFKIKYILRSLNLHSPIAVVGKNTKKYCGDLEYIYESDINDIDISFLKKCDSVIGIGGGKNIDAGKYLSHKLNIPFISVPTTASNDGIASPIISRTQPSYYSTSPIAIIADINVIEKSPKNLLSAGMGDVVSNITAVLDWKLSKIENFEKYSDSSAIFSKTIATELMEYVLTSDLKEYSKKLVTALIGSGISIAIANSSRPASGSEHLFSHALDSLKIKYDLKNKSLHGEQCAIGTLISLQLYLEEKRIKNMQRYGVEESLKRINCPTLPSSLGYDMDILIEALTNAHSIRNRYTIFRNGLSRERAKNILEILECIN